MPVMVPARPTIGSVGSCAPKLFSMKPKRAPPRATEKSFAVVIAPPPWPFLWCFFFGAARGALTRMIGCATRGAEYRMICALLVFATAPPFFRPHVWGLFRLLHLAMSTSVTGGG